jgi:hypothetical protein
MKLGLVKEDETVPVHVMRVYERVEVYLHAFLTLALDRVSGQLQTPATLPPEKNSQNPLDMRQCGSHILCGRIGEEINILPLPGFEQPLPHPPALSLVIMTD